jgi:hypothetical protein
VQFPPLAYSLDGVAVVFSFAGGTYSGEDYNVFLFGMAENTRSYLLTSPSFALLIHWLL